MERKDKISVYDTNIPAYAALAILMAASILAVALMGRMPQAAERPVAEAYCKQLSIDGTLPLLPDGAREAFVGCSGTIWYAPNEEISYFDAGSMKIVLHDRKTRTAYLMAGESMAAICQADKDSPGVQALEAAYAEEAKEGESFLEYAAAGFADFCLDPHGLKKSRPLAYGAWSEISGKLPMMAAKW